MQQNAWPARIGQGWRRKWERKRSDDTGRRTTTEAGIEICISLLLTMSRFVPASLLVSTFRGQIKLQFFHLLLRIRSNFSQSVQSSPIQTRAIQHQRSKRLSLSLRYICIYVGHVKCDLHVRRYDDVHPTNLLHCPCFRNLWLRWGGKGWLLARAEGLYLTHYLLWAWLNSISEPCRINCYKFCENVMVTLFSFRAQTFMIGMTFNNDETVTSEHGLVKVHKQQQ